MPARVVVVLGPDLSEETAAALGKAGYEAAALADPMIALDALESAERVELLITRLDFGDGKPNGIALARMTRHKRPKIAVIFVGPADFARYSSGLGEYMESPSTVSDILESAKRLLDEKEQSNS
jgi:DNA-binding NtrC family response regulator